LLAVSSKRVGYAIIANIILLTHPITGAGEERSFSKLKLIKKTFLRFTMSQGRLGGLATIAMERAIAEELE